jgi:hypothetical protein
MKQAADSAARDPRRGEKAYGLRVNAAADVEKFAVSFVRRKR